MNDQALTEENVKVALKELKDPETGRDVVAMEQVRDIACTDNSVSFTLELTSHSSPLKLDTHEEAVELIRRRFPAATEVNIELAEHDRKPGKLGQIGLTAKSVIAVGSGKGGVGKSTIAASMAYGLTRAGAKVGLMDADVYGPSIPHLVGVSGRPAVTEEKKIIPAEKDGLKIMSMGLLVDPEQAVIWRGPMLHGAIMQFLRDTAWGDLDYLIIDMPPGTGDIALTLSQSLPLSGAVVVCTPQDVALLDAVKAIAMFRQVQIPVLGVVENMSGFICPDCGKKYDIFGSGGARQKAEEMDVPFLGEAPINMAIRERCDESNMSALFEDPITSAPLEKISYALSRHLSQLAKKSPPKPELPVL